MNIKLCPGKYPDNGPFSAQFSVLLGLIHSNVFNFNENLNARINQNCRCSRNRPSNRYGQNNEKFVGRIAANHQRLMISKGLLQ